MKAEDLYIGSGDVVNLLSGKNTQGYHCLMNKFINNDRDHYNSLLTPIPQLRTGAIIEKIYLKHLPYNFLPQVNVIHKAYDVCRSTLDFAIINSGEIVDFIELKTLNYFDFAEIYFHGNMSYEEYIVYIKKHYRKIYNQIQYQLWCSGLNQCQLHFVVVIDYDDEENWNREFNDNDICKFIIKKDDDVIDRLFDRIQIFQQIKDNYKND